MDISIKHIVCSGGGHSGIIYYGILKELNKKGFWDIKNIETFHGTSVGCIISVFISLKCDWDILDDFIIKRPWQTVFKFNMYSLIESITKEGIFNVKVIEDLFMPLFKANDISINITMDEFYNLTNIHHYFYTTDINSLKILEISHKTHPEWRLIDAVYSSCAIPIIFSPYFKEGICYYDGGMLSNYPISHCLSKEYINPDEVLGIRTYGGVKENKVIEKDKTLFYYIIIIFFILLDNLVSNRYISSIKYEVRTKWNRLSLENLYNATNDSEYRKQLIQEGIDIANEFYSSNVVSL